MINELLNKTINALFGVDINGIFDENQDMKAQISSLIRESASLKEKLADIQTKKDELATANQGLTTQISNLKTSVNELRNEAEILRENVKAERREKERVQEELADIQTQKNELATANQGLTTQISNLKTSADELKREAENYREKFEAEKAERESVQEKLADIQTQKNELATANQGLTTQISNLKTSADELKNEARNYREKFEAEKAERENVQKELAVIQAKKDELATANQDLTTQISNLNTSVNELRNEAEILRENVKAENDALKEKIKKLEEEIANKGKEEVPNTEDEEEKTKPVSEVDSDVDDLQEGKPEEPKIQEPTIKRVSKHSPNKQKVVEVLEKAGDCIEDFPEIKNEDLHTVKRTIEFVYDKEGQKIYADDFFANSSAEEIARVSRQLAEADKTGAESWTCGLCHAKVKVAHRTYKGVESLFFIHASRDHYCPWIKRSEKAIDTITVLEEDLTEDDAIGENTGEIRPFSRQLKEKIFSALTTSQSSEQGISNVKMDTIVRSSLPYMKWRRPDLSFEYNGKKVVVELQRRKTSLDTIVDKDIFYRLNNIHVLWVFGSDSDTSYQYMRQANYKNTMFANHRNVFVFDKEAQGESERSQVLSLKCNWLDENDKWAIRTETERRNGRIITLPELTFDEEFCKPYFFDANEPYFSLHPEAKAEYLKSILSREELLKQLEEKWTRDSNYEEAIRQMKERGLKAEVWKYGGLWGFRFNSTSLIQPIFTEEPQKLSNGYYKVKLGDAWGIVNCYGQKIVDWDGRFKCEDIDFDHNNHRVLIKNYGEWGVADTKGMVMVLCQFSSIENWTAEAYRVKQNGKWGIFNLEGRLIVPCKYCKIESLIGNKAKAELLASNDWQILHGTIDSLGNPIPDERIYMPDGLVAVKVFERWGLLDSEKYLLEPEYEQISYWGMPSLYRVKKGGKWGVVNATSKEMIVPIQYDGISKLTDGVASLERVGQTTKVDANGNEVSQEEVLLQDGLRKIKKSGKWGIVDKDNNEVVPCLYDEIGSFRSRMIGVINGRIVKLNAWYNYPIQLQATFERKTTTGLVFDIAGVKCFLPLQFLKLMNKTQQDIIDNQGLCHVLAFSNIIIKDNKIMMRICEGEKLNKPLSHGDKDTDFQMGEVLTGVVYETRRFMTQTKKVLVKFEDGRKSMVPVRIFNNCGQDINDYPINSSITLKKVGFDDELDQTIWDIVDQQTTKAEKTEPMDPEFLQKVIDDVFGKVPK